MSDLISRHAAINAVNTALFPKINTAKDAEKALKELPSEQPEIIRCKECRYYEWMSNRVPDEQTWVCHNWNAETGKDDFCSYAERRDEMDDMILRQAAVDAVDGGAELIRRVLDNMELVGSERSKFEWGLGLLESCINDLNELPSAQPEQRWIPCSERLPEFSVHKKDPSLCEWDNSEPVLVYCKNSEGIFESQYLIAEYTNGFWEEEQGDRNGWRGIEFADEIVDVIAWMPLPEPYDPLTGHMNPPEDE